MSSIRTGRDGNIDEIVESGEAIAECLARGDLTGRWMAQYLAETLDKAARSAGPEAATARGEAANLILQIWERREQWPVATAPLASFEALHAALGRLSPDQPAWNFYGFFDQAAAPPHGSVPLLAVALELEQSARDVVSGCIVVAAQAAVDQEGPWLAVAERLANAGDAPLLELRRRLAHFQGDHRELSDNADRPNATTELLGAITRLTDTVHSLQRSLLGPGRS